MYSAGSSSPISMKLGSSWPIFEKSSNIKFHKYLSIGRRVVPCGRTDGRAEITKLIVAFRNFAKEVNNVKELQPNLWR